MCAKFRANAPWWFASFTVEALPFHLTVTDPDLAHHVATVSRLKPGEALVLVDENTQIPYAATLDSVQGKSFTVTLTQALPTQAPQKPLWALVSLIKEQRWDWLLQKLAELGVTHIVPVEAHRSVVHPGAKSKLARWEKILRQAAQQSEQVHLSQLHPPMGLDQALALVPQDALKLAALEREEGSLQTALDQIPTAPALVFAIGPEGGWTEAEVGTLQSHGYTAVSLGTAILRAETAGILLAGLLRHGR